MARNKELLQLLKSWALRYNRQLRDYSTPESYDLETCIAELCEVLRLNDAIVVPGLGMRALDALITEQPLPDHCEWYLLD